jgi:hypothetical protein
VRHLPQEFRLAYKPITRHHTPSFTMVPFLSDISTHDPTFQWILVAGAVVTLFYAVVRPAMKKKKDPLERQPSVSSLAQQRNVERQMQTLLVELSEMTRQITAQLDTRTQKLMILIEDADQRIAELKKLESQPGAAQQKPWPALTESAVPRHIPIPEPADEQHQPIYHLADQGRSASDIARELNRPRGEVELILALRPAP